MGREQSEAKVVAQQRALNLRLSGLRYRQIAARMGCSPTAVHGYVKEALAELREQNAALADELRSIELSRLDKLWNGLWPKRKDPRVADTLARLSERRAKLSGLDAPTKNEDVTPRAPALEPEDQVKAIADYLGITPEEVLRMEQARREKDA